MFATKIFRGAVVVASFSPEVWVDALALGAIYVQRGINNFDDWSAKMTESCGTKIEPWLSAIWETLCDWPEGSKFNDKQILALADRIGGLYGHGITSLYGIAKAIEDDIGAENTEKLFPMIQANYMGIKRYFDDLERKRSLETWQSTILETLYNIPESSKLNEKQIVALANRIGGLYEDGTTSLFGIAKVIEDDLGTENTKKLFPTIRAYYMVIKKYFDTLKRKRSPAPEKLRWKVEGKILTVGGVREIKTYSYGDLPWVRSVDAIQEIVIAEGVEKISAEAFSECKRLELLTIPASVKTIGDFAFTFCYCGNRAVNGGKNVIWSLADGVLTFKKNPAVRNASDFSIGAVSWLAVEKNITGFKLEAGVVPKEKFFEWLSQRDNAQISFA